MGLMGVRDCTDAVPVLPSGFFYRGGCTLHARVS